MLDARRPASRSAAPNGNAVKHFETEILGFSKTSMYEKCQIPGNPQLKRFSQKGIWQCLAGSKMIAHSTNDELNPAGGRTRRSSGRYLIGLSQ
jgi:ribosomal protein L37AE/L43A